jgi:hypothetical protein
MINKIQSFFASAIIKILVLFILVSYAFYIVLSKNANQCVAFCLMFDELQKKLNTNATFKNL